MGDPSPSTSCDVFNGEWIIQLHVLILTNYYINVKVKYGKQTQLKVYIYRVQAGTINWWHIEQNRFNNYKVK